MRSKRAETGPVGHGLSPSTRTECVPDGFCGLGNGGRIRDDEPVCFEAELSQHDAEPLASWCVAARDARTRPLAWEAAQAHGAAAREPAGGPGHWEARLVPALTDLSRD